MIQNKETLKTYFETGDKPTQEQYEDLIDSLRHEEDKITLSDLEENPKTYLTEGSSNVNIEGDGTLASPLEIFVEETDISGKVDKENSKGLALYPVPLIQSNLTHVVAYTLNASDNGRIVLLNSGGTNSKGLIIPKGLPSHFKCLVRAYNNNLDFNANSPSGESTITLEDAGSENQTQTIYGDVIIPNNTVVEIIKDENENFYIFNKNDYVSRKFGGSFFSDVSNPLVGKDVGSFPNIYLGGGSSVLLNRASTFIGYRAGDNTSSYYNVFVGYQAGRYSGGHANSIYVGTDSGYGIKSGRNIVVGANALYNANVKDVFAFGYEAGRESTANNCVYFGDLVGHSNTTDNLLNFFNIIKGDLVTKQIDLTSVKLNPLTNTPLSPTAGLIYFDDNLKKHRAFDGTNWNNLY